MPHSRAEFLRRSRRWLLPAALLAVTPKCLLCLAAYAGLGAALGLSGPEICGASDDATFPWLSALVLGSAAVGLVGVYVRHRRRREQR